MAAKHKRRKGKNATVTSVAEDKLDRGTLQTRSRLSPDPLLSPTLEPHRREAGEAIRAALEEGVGAKGLDIVRIGMGGGASSGHREPTPFQRHIDLRMWQRAWERTAAAKGIPIVFAKQFAEGQSIRQIAKHHVLSRHKVTDIVNEGLDLYADLRGFRRQQQHPRISVYENESFVPPETDQPIYAMPPKAALISRNFA
ncbi:hypothetical protein HFO84_35655 [Rhizobium leguminosarum]|uniref:hypothetical protein n=1 Tax=Rhizobium leguminosarum TaxID=384 RepID=UPI001C9785E0|nr:hypothetical protein [Rhizobium leguminosarum]MBY5482609.1 hypothetical protein [Rhizobium leguminosarum]